jgi:hypothetical protein
MTFAKRNIELTFAYGTGDNGQGPPQVVTVSGLRMSVQIDIPGGAGLATAQMRIYGLTPDIMNQLSTTGRWAFLFRKNTVIIKAGDEGSSMDQVFVGQITMAWQEMETAPETSFNVTASSGMYESLLNVGVSSYPGAADVAVILSNLVASMNQAGNLNPPITFENHGVSVILSTPYYSGGARAQAAAAVKDANIEWNGIENNVLSIWPRGGYRAGQVPIISVDTGMVGYPSFTQSGVVVRTLFNSAIRFGQLVEVRSSLQGASGQYRVQKLAHDIESGLPGAKWFTQMVTVRQGAFT